MPVKGGTNCGGGEWMDVATGLAGCEAYYKARYASTLEIFNYIFPAKFSYSPRSQFPNGEQYSIHIETHNQNGDNVGGAILGIIECDIGYVLKSLNCIKEITNTGCSPDLNANPCSASSGNKFQIEKDYVSRTLSFIRYYNSLSPQYTNMGAQWTHNYSAHLKFDLAKGIVGSYQGNRSLAIFKKVSNEWIDDSSSNLHLQENGNLWELKTSNDTLETYNQDGQLVSYQLRNGLVYQLEYTGNNLDKVISPYGPSLQFLYDNKARISTIITPENTQIYYEYDENNNLIKVIFPDTTPGDLENNPKKIYHYERPDRSSFLTGITNENGVRYATWDYDTSNRATLSEHANSVEKVELAYNTDETTTVTDALGRIKKYTFETHYGLRKPKTIEYTYNDGHQVVTKHKTYTYYPDNGRVKEVTDYNGNITYYEYNNRGLITLETQGKGTPEEYNVSTTWHPSYRLPATRTYPDRTETYSYNSTGQLINTQISSNP